MQLKEQQEQIQEQMQEQMQQRIGVSRPSKPMYNFKTGIQVSPMFIQKKLLKIKNTC